MNLKSLIVGHVTAPLPLTEFVKQRPVSAPATGDYDIPDRHSTLGQTVLSIKCGNLWNSLTQLEDTCSTF